MRELAIEMSATSGGRIVLGVVSLDRFPDSFPNIFIRHAEVLRWADTAFLASFHEPGVIFEQISFVWMLPQHSVRSLQILLPFFPTGTMERVVRLGEVATAKTLARLVSATPLTQRGPPHVLMLDLHTLQNQFYFEDSVIPLLHTATGLLLRELRARSDIERVSICFPDDGAHKRFGTLFPGFPQIVCAKVRHPDGHSKLVTVKDGDCAGRHVVIIDDLIHSGGTMLQCVKACHAAGADKISAFCTHAVFENQAWRRFTAPFEAAAVSPAAAPAVAVVSAVAPVVGAGAGAVAEAAAAAVEDVAAAPVVSSGTGAELLDTFYITNSHPMSAELRTRRPFKVLSIAPVLQEAIFEYSA